MDFWPTGLLILLTAQVLMTVVIVRLLGRAGGEADSSSFESKLSDELARSRRESRESEQLARRELQAALKDFSDSLDKRMQAVGVQVERRLEMLQRDNTRKLDQMRETVDEKLQATLEKRLGESFKQVGDRLEQVYKGLGEMQSLARDAGDLKRVLTNVKTRGTWGEIQLENLLEQILTKDQYAKNVAVHHSSPNRVEFAIRIPAKDDDNGIIWLPIDAKFPIEDYQRLMDAEERADKAGIEAAGKALENRVKEEAKKINTKYLHPPETTDFAILYVPTEGLYAEIVQRGDLANRLQREYRVTVAGPQTISAILNSLQMGFRTLAIQQRTSQVWEVLGTVKTEFGKFGDLLDKTRKKLDEASNSLDDATRKSRTIERGLRKVEQLQPGDGQEKPVERAASIGAEV